MLNPFLKSIIQEIGNNRYLPTFLPKITILIVAIQVDRDRYEQYLQSNVIEGARSYCFLEAETIEKGLELWRSQSPDIVLLDLNFPSVDGLKFLAAIADHTEDMELPVIVLTEQSKEGMAAKAMKLGAVDYLIKEELTKRSLSESVDQICDRIARTRQLQAKIHHLQSAQKRASILLSESEQRYKSLAASAPVGIYRADRAGQCIYVNERYCQMTGLTPEVALGDGWRQGIHLDDREILIEAWQQSIQNNHCPFQLEYRFQHADGQVVWVYGQCVAERNDDGELLGYVGTLTDISDRKQVEIALQKSESNSRAILAAIPDILFRMGTDGVYRKYVTENRDFDLFQSSDPSDYLLTDLVPPEVAERHLYYTHRAIETGELQIYEQQVLVRGRLQDEEVRVIKTGDDEVLFMIRDISDRKQAERALKKSESNSQAILATIPDLMVRVGSDGIYREFVAQKSFSILPSHLDITGSAMTDLIPLEIAKQQFEAMQQALRTGELQIYEQQIQVGDRIQDEEVRIIKTGDDEVLFIIRDISDSKQAERDLKKSEITNRAIIETIPDLLIQMDLDGNYINMLAGSGVRVIKSAESNGIPEIHAILSPDLVADRLHYAKQAIATDSLQVYEQIITFEDEQRYEEVRIAPLNDHEVLVIIRDINDAKQAETERLNNAELRRATRLKDEFLANMSHELRTPLNAILGMTEGLLEQVFGNLNDRQINALKTIEGSSSHLLELINDILDIAKIESGQIELNYQPTSIVSLCQSSLTFIRQQAIAKRIQIKTLLPTNLPDLLVDDLRIRQVLINLLNNAVKFTGEGGQIMLEAAFIPQREDLETMRNHLQISITDTGIGISPENISKLFQPFIQIDSALNRKYEGTGLGLALVKQIVELHGGAVELTSELGVGSCFTVTLPYIDNVTPPPIVDTQAEPTHEPSLPNGNHKLSILIAVDNEANVATISSYLEAYGYHLLIANNGEEAIALTQSDNPDLILMDIQMPSMDGIETIQKIRQIPSLVNVPIIALTALAMPDDRDRCLAAGASEYMPKPVKLKALVKMIHHLLNP